VSERKWREIEEGIAADAGVGSLLLEKEKEL